MARINAEERVGQSWWDTLPEDWKSKCHPGVKLHEAPVLWVKNDGSEKLIGCARYCPTGDWKGGVFEDCMKIRVLNWKKKVWPSSLKPADFPTLIGRGGPGYWLSYGFHIALDGEDWVGLRVINYLPPNLGDEELIPAARQILRYRKRREHKMPPVENLEPHNAQRKLL